MAKYKYIYPTRQLIALRYLKDVSQIKMAEYLGICQATYARKERGDSFFNVKEINAILDFFNIEFEKLFRRRAK